MDKNTSTSGLLSNAPIHQQAASLHNILRKWIRVAESFLSLSSSRDKDDWEIPLPFPYPYRTLIDKDDSFLDAIAFIKSFWSWLSAIAFPGLDSTFRQSDLLSSRSHTTSHSLHNHCVILLCFASLSPSHRVGHFYPNCSLFCDGERAFHDRYRRWICVV